MASENDASPSDAPDTAANEASPAPVAGEKLRLTKPHRLIQKAMEKEPDPVVRLTAYQTAAMIGFVEEAHIKEAVRILS